MIYTIHARTADGAAGDQTTKTNVIRTESMKKRGIKAMNNQAIEVIKDEYCADCMWKEENPAHCDCCMVGDILGLLKGLEDENDDNNA